MVVALFIKFLGYFDCLKWTSHVQPKLISFLFWKFSLEIGLVTALFFHFMRDVLWYFSHSVSLETCTPLYLCDANLQFRIHPTQNWNSATIQMNDDDDDTAIYAVSFIKLFRIFAPSITANSLECISCFLETITNVDFAIVFASPQSRTMKFQISHMKPWFYDDFLVHRSTRKQYFAIFDCSKLVSSFPWVSFLCAHHFVSINFVQRVCHFLPFDSETNLCQRNSLVWPSPLRALHFSLEMSKFKWTFRWNCGD